MDCFSALKQMQSYLTERKQIIKINQAYSSWEGIFSRVSKGSILGTILFNTKYLFCKLCKRHCIITQVAI